MPGYSGTPLGKKLGFKPGCIVFVHNAPTGFLDELEGLAEGVAFVGEMPTKVEAAHLFVVERSTLNYLLSALRPILYQEGMIWVSWPKKASKVPTDVTEDVIREIALPMGYVDIKVCAVSEVWSGLKLVIRKSERSS